MRFTVKVLFLSALSMIGACKERSFSDTNEAKSTVQTGSQTVAAEQIKWNSKFRSNKLQFETCMSSPETQRDKFAACLTYSLLWDGKGSLQIFDEKYIAPLLFSGVERSLECSVEKNALIPLFNVTSYGEGSNWSIWIGHLTYGGWYRLNPSVVGEYFVFERTKSELPQSIWDKIDSDTFNGHRKLQEKNSDISYFIKFNPKDVGLLSFGQMNLKTKKELWRCDPKQSD